MQFELPELPFSPDALAPHISRLTMNYHYDKHHRAYVSKLNALIKDTAYATLALDEIIRKSSGKRGEQTIFNNAAQAWNHTFFWYSMTPGGGGAPTGTLASRLNRDLGGYEEFRRLFVEVAIGQFGSGWVWLVLDEDRLAIVSTPDAQTPLVAGKTPLLTCDVWEHAYYLDYQNRRQDFVETFLAHLVNWDHVAERLARAPQVENVKMASRSETH